MRKILTTFFATLVVALLFPRTAFGFGITPAEIYVDDLKPGGHLEKQIYVTRQPDEVNEELNVILDTDLGEMENWFSFDPGKEFPFPYGKNVTSFNVRIDVPRGVDIKNFEGRITAKGATGKKASAGVTIIKGAILGVNITTSDANVSKLKVLSMEAPDVNKGDSVRLLLNVENLGNIAEALDRVDLEVMDLFEKPMESLSDSTLPKIDPFATKEVQAEFNSNLEKGQYRIDAAAIFKGKEIFRKKMVLTVNAKPSQVSEEEEREAMARKEALRKVGQNYYRLSLALIALGGLLLALILLIIFKKVAVSKPKYAVKISKMIKDNKSFAWAMVLGSLLLIMVGLYLYLLSGGEVGRGSVKKTVDLGTEQAASMSAETGDQVEVKGVSTETVEVIEETSDDGVSVKVSRPGTPGLYPIFTEPEFGAEIMYEAEDGESFLVTTVEGEWYKVTMEDGTSGWLHQTSVGSE